MSASKIKLRAEILSVLSKYNTKKDIKPDILKKDIEYFSDFEEKELLSKILLTEMLSGEKRYAKYCSLFVLRALDKPSVIKAASKILEDKTVPDKKKIYMLSILKQKEIFFDSDEIEKYIDNIEQTASDGVKDFLICATNNPEAQIDLLDFYCSITSDERIALLENLTANSTGDEEINALSLITSLELSKKERQMATEALLSAKSIYALKGLKNLETLEETEDIYKKKIQKKIKEIEFKNPKYKNTALIETSTPYKCFISFTDGMGDFALIFSRIDKKKFIETFFAKANVELGITSVVGFYKIEKRSFQEILLRLFADSPPVEIEPPILVSFLDYYSQKNEKTNTTLPYEFDIWFNLTNDIKKYTEDLSLYFNSKLNVVNIPKNKISAVFKSKITESWFYVKNQNKKTDKIFSLLNKENISSYEKFEEDVLNFIDKEFLTDKNFIDIFKTRLLLQAYISKLAKFDKIADYLYSICYNEEYIKEFLNYIFQISIHNNLLQYIEEKDEENVFKEKQKPHFTDKEIKKIINSIEKKWK